MTFFQAHMSSPGDVRRHDIGIGEGNAHGHIGCTFWADDGANPELLEARRAYLHDEVLKVLEAHAEKDPHFKAVCEGAAPPCKHDWESTYGFNAPTLTCRKCGWVIPD